MSIAYVDVACVDDLDPFARDVDPLTGLAQELYHWLITDPGTLLGDSDWGFGVSAYVGRALPQSFSALVESGIRFAFSDCIDDARCAVTALDAAGSKYRVDIKAQVAGAFLDLAIEMAPDGVKRIG